MDLRRLNHLVALADTRNFSRAATQCHLSQPAFSRSVQAAEEELGLQLFDRNALEVTCTDTVLACPDAGAVQEVQGKRLVRLDVSDLPPVYNEMGLFALKGRSHSPMAKFAVDYFVTTGAEQAALS